MKASDVLELLRAGYTKTEIAALDIDLAPVDPAPADPAPADPAPADDPSTGPDPAPASDPAPDPSSGADKPKWASALEASIAALTKTMQANARMNDEQPDEPASAADTALATYLTGGRGRK